MARQRSQRASFFQVLMNLSCGRCRHEFPPTETRLVWNASNDLALVCRGCTWDSDRLEIEGALGIRKLLTPAQKKGHQRTEVIRARVEGARLAAGFKKKYRPRRIPRRWF